MSIEISFRGQSIEAVSLQVKEELKGTTLTRNKVVECCKAIFDAQDHEAAPLKFFLKKIKRRLFDKERKDAVFGVFAEKVWESVKVIPRDSIDRLPLEVLKQVLNQLSGVGNALLVSPRFNVAAEAAMLERVYERAQEARSNAFGAAEWMEFIGAEVGEEPPLPADILEILADACPFSGDGRIVADTQLLMLIPETINGGPLNLNTLGELFKAKFPDIGGGTGYSFTWVWDHQIQANAKNHEKSRWVLMTRDVIEGSRNKTFRGQKALIVKRGQNKYEVPLALVAAACIFLEYARTKGQTRLYSDEPWTYTRCQEKVEDWRVVVGGFVPAGLNISSYYYDLDCVGVAAMRKL